MGLPRRFSNFDLEAEIQGTPRGTPWSQNWPKIFFQKSYFFCFVLLPLYLDRCRKAIITHKNFILGLNGVFEVEKSVLGNSAFTLNSSKSRYAGTNPWWKKNLKRCDPSKYLVLSISYSLRLSRKKSACKYCRYTPKGVSYSI